MQPARPTSVDCLADKGYSITGHRLAPGCEELQLINTHLQAGKRGDFAVNNVEHVRAYQTRKLLSVTRSTINLGLHQRSAKIIKLK